MLDLNVSPMPHLIRVVRLGLGGYKVTTDFGDWTASIVIQSPATLAVILGEEIVTQLNLGYEVMVAINGNVVRKGENYDDE